MEVRYKTETIIVEFLCPMCTIGHLKPIGNMSLTTPIMYPHRCDSMYCNYEESFSRQYPYTEITKVLADR